MSSDTLYLAISFPDTLQKQMSHVPITLMDSITVVAPDSFQIVNTLPYYSDPAYIAIFIAIAALFVPHVIAGLVENYKESNRLSELENNFFLLLNSLLEPLERQIRNYRELGSELLEMEIREIDFNDEVDLNRQDFGEVSYQDIFKILMLRNKKSEVERGKQFNSIFHGIRYIGSRSESNKIKFERIHESLRSHEDEFKKNTNLILRKLDFYFSQFMRHRSNRLISDSFLTKCQCVVKKWRDSEEHVKIKQIRNLMLVPLHDHCKQHIDDNRSPEILEYIVDAEIAFNTMNKLQNKYSSYFLSEAACFEVKKKKLIEAIGFFQSQPKRHKNQSNCSKTHTQSF